ncbi:hypothetical protein [Streptomyces sp. H39-C1]|uniref:hypothetical protein n=1 Tax=Streptomyces sp. H39-C1 TaxID=3004355 RepID=UPI0022AE9D92|nr:hypothetical protein [Streptomyces sp. H39-C1]MCZ4103746.1 hypothetical protein [Streptomyces sp. H39-C1]
MRRFAITTGGQRVVMGRYLCGSEMISATPSSSEVTRAAQAAGTVAELPKVLWGRGQHAVALGTVPPSHLRDGHDRSV